MSSIVLQCPLCSQPFQVVAEQSGQAVQCPTCQGTVAIPAELTASPAPPQSPPHGRDDPLVFGCPVCDGQFGITAEMYGQQVSCPHCQSTVLVRAPDSASPRIQIPKIGADAETVGERDSEEEKIRAAAFSGVSQIVVDSAAAQPRSTAGDKGADADKPGSLATEWVPQNLDHLLPPRFDVLDPERLAVPVRGSVDHQIILPDGKGGLKKVDDRIVRVKHGDEEIKLVSLSPAELRHRRQMQTAIFMIGGAIILAILFALLQKSV